MKVQKLHNLYTAIKVLSTLVLGLAVCTVESSAEAINRSESEQELLNYVQSHPLTLQLQSKRLQHGKIAAQQQPFQSKDIIQWLTSLVESEEAQGRLVDRRVIYAYPDMDSHPIELTFFNEPKILVDALEQILGTPNVIEVPINKLIGGSDSETVRFIQKPLLISDYLAAVRASEQASERSVISVLTRLFSPDNKADDPAAMEAAVLALSNYLLYGYAPGLSFPSLELKIPSAEKSKFQSEKQFEQIKKIIALREVIDNDLDKNFRAYTVDEVLALSKILWRLPVNFHNLPNLEKIYPVHEVVDVSLSENPKTKQAEYRLTVHKTAGAAFKGGDQFYNQSYQNQRIVFKNLAMSEEGQLRCFAVEALVHELVHAMDAERGRKTLGTIENQLFAGFSASQKWLSIFKRKLSSERQTSLSVGGAEACMQIGCQHFPEIQNSAMESLEIAERATSDPAKNYPISHPIEQLAYQATDYFFNKSENLSLEQREYLQHNIFHGWQYPGINQAGCVR